MYDYFIRKHVEKIFYKLAKRNPKQLRIIKKKIIEITKNPHRYKNLKAPLEKFKRVHIDKHFVLIFSVDENKRIVKIEDFQHHDEIYRR